MFYVNYTSNSEEHAAMVANMIATLPDLTNEMDISVDKRNYTVTVQHEMNLIIARDSWGKYLVVSLLDKEESVTSPYNP